MKDFVEFHFMLVIASKAPLDPQCCFFWKKLLEAEHRGPPRGESMLGKRLAGKRLATRLEQDGGSKLQGEDSTEDCAEPREEWGPAGDKEKERGRDVQEMRAGRKRQGKQGGGNQKWFSSDARRGEKASRKECHLSVK